MSEQSPIVVRFTQQERYDINRDAETVLFMATTTRGSFFTEFEKQGLLDMRQKKARFRELAVEAIQRGDEPCELQL